MAANAITASGAPDLAEALADLLDLIDQGPPKDMTIWSIEWTNAQDAARAALSKAKGEPKP